MADRIGRPMSGPVRVVESVAYDALSEAAAATAALIALAQEIFVAQAAVVATPAVPAAVVPATPFAPVGGPALPTVRQFRVEAIPTGGNFTTFIGQGGMRIEVSG